MKHTPVKNLKKIRKITGLTQLETAKILNIALT
jgi:transcriptional regulator with XRE-family HTH domain